MHPRQGRHQAAADGGGQAGDAAQLPAHAEAAGGALSAVDDRP